MAKIETADFITGIHGKLSKKECLCYRTQSRTGKKSLYAMRLSANQPTEKQTQCRRTFAERSRRTAQWLRENEGTPQYAAMLHAFNEQTDTGVFFSFVNKRLHDEDNHPL